MSKGKFYVYVQPGCKVGNLKNGTVKFKRLQNLWYIIRAYLNAKATTLPEIFWRSVISSGLVPWRDEFEVELVHVNSLEEANAIIAKRIEEEKSKQTEEELDSYIQEQADKYSTSTKKEKKETKPTLH